MWLRISGIFLILFGAALALVAITGTLQGPSLATFVDAAAGSSNVADFDYCVWLTHWKLWGIATSCAGAAVTVAGIALAFRRYWGLAVLAAVLILAAAAPMVLQALGMARYPYERASAIDTVRLLARSALAGGKHRDPCDVAYDDGAKHQEAAVCEARARSGGPNAQFSYGLILWSGHDRKSDHKAALEWFRKSARQGHLLAQVSLGEFLSHQEVEPELRNRVEAYAWWVAAGETRAAEQLLATLSTSDANAAQLLGVEYRTKYGEKRPAVKGP